MSKTTSKVHIKTREEEPGLRPNSSSPSPLGYRSYSLTSTMTVSFFSSRMYACCPFTLTRAAAPSAWVTAVTQALGAAARVKVKGQQAYILDEKNDTVMVLVKE